MNKTAHDETKAGSVVRDEAELAAIKSASNRADEDALRLHRLYHGKIQIAPKCPIRDASDFAWLYTPGVAAACRAIQADPAEVYEFTNKANLIAVISDGSRVSGLGNIGPVAGLPKVEGKALLFKYLGGVDAVALCLGTQDEQELVRTVQLLEPSFGGINLEDIARPRCFRVTDELRRTMKIPIWHDDQQGTATVVLAGLLNALKIVGKTLSSVRIAMIGMGAANTATYRLLKAAGADPDNILGCDSRGMLHRDRRDIEENQSEVREKWAVCLETNPRAVSGGIKQTMLGADICLAFARPDSTLIKPAWVRSMAPDAIVFACANPEPEIWPNDAKNAGARIAETGRPDFCNSLVFPAIFRGTLDARASAISDEMALAAAQELACCAEEGGVTEETILPQMDDVHIVARVAAAVALKAQEQGLASVARTHEEYMEYSSRRILHARHVSRMLMKDTAEREPL